jgi:TolB protein
VNRARRARAVGVVLAGAVACSGGGEAARCPDRDTVLVVNRTTSDDGFYDLLALRDDGHGRRITDWTATQPSLAPDGRRVAVVRPGPDGDYESGGPASETIWVVRLDGSGARRLTTGRWDGEPAWSPDGRLVAFTRRAGPSGARDVLVVPAGGGAPTVVARGGSDATLPRALAWSPDGDEIGFVRGGEVRSVGVDGTGERVVAVLPDVGEGHFVHSMRWHPGGGSILVSMFGREEGDVHLVDVATGEVREVADHATLAAWGPDGESVYYYAKRVGADALWRLGEGRLVDGRLARVRDVGRANDYLYARFGLAVGCA